MGLVKLRHLEQYTMAMELVARAWLLPPEQSLQILQVFVPKGYGNKLVLLGQSLFHPASLFGLTFFFLFV